MQYTIKYIKREPFESQFGPTQKLSLTTEEKPTQWLSAFEGNWNKSWKKGDKIELAKEQIKKVEKNGKIYINLVAPPEARSGGVNMQVINTILERIDSIEKRVDKLEDPLTIDGPQESDSEELDLEALEEFCEKSDEEPF